MSSGGGGEEIDKLVRRRFDIICKLGKGAYGIVWQAREKRSGAKGACAARYVSRDRAGGST